MFEFIGNELTIIMWSKHLDLVLYLCCYKCFEIFEFFQPLFRLQSVHPYLPWKFVKWRITCIAHIFGSYRATHIQMYNLERFSCLPHLHCWKTLPYVIYSQYMLHKSMKIWERNLPRFMPLTMFWMPSTYPIWTSKYWNSLRWICQRLYKPCSQMMPS